MASSFTARLRYEKQADGENSNTWGGLVNTVFDLIDEARAGYLSKSVAGGSNVTLTANNSATDENRQAVIEFTGAITANIDVIVATVENWWLIKNSTTGAFTLTVKTSAGSGIAVTQGKWVHLYCDGTDVIESAVPAGLQSVQVFTGDGTWTKPAGINRIVTIVVGGGGGGGGAQSATQEAGGGGGGGGTVIEFISAPSASETITVGAGGAGGIGSNAGAAGGTSSFGSLSSATGGGGGANNTDAFAVGGANGVGSDGDVNIGGGDGMASIADAALAMGKGGDGGTSTHGGSGSGIAASGSGIGSAGSNYGGGGGGAVSLNNTSRTGGAGAGGLIIVWEYT